MEVIGEFEKGHAGLDHDGPVGGARGEVKIGNVVDEFGPDDLGGDVGTHGVVPHVSFATCPDVCAIGCGLDDGDDLICWVGLKVVVFTNCTILSLVDGWMDGRIMTEREKKKKLAYCRQHWWHCELLSRYNMSEILHHRSCRIRRLAHRYLWPQQQRLHHIGTASRGMGLTM